MFLGIDDAGSCLTAAEMIILVFGVFSPFVVGDYFINITDINGLSGTSGS